jgi:hypothetical protein
MTREHLRERAFSGAIRSHDRVHLTVAKREIDAFENLVARNGDAQPFDFEQCLSLSQRFPPS